MNPMAPFQGGSVGGPLGELASTQAKGLSDFDKKSLIAADAVDAGLAIAAFTTVAFAAAEAAAAGAAASAAVPAGLAVAAAAAIKTTYDAASASAYGNADSFFNMVESQNDPTDPKNKAHLDLEEAKQKAGVGIPDPENQGVQVSIVSGSILNQLKAAQAGKPISQGGSGDATPVDDGGLGGVVRVGSIAPNQSSIHGRNLLGRPVGPGGENISGGNKGLNGFGNSNGAGVINPGPDGGTPQGDERFAEDPGRALGGRQPSPNLGGGSTAGRQSGSQAKDLVLNGTTGADTLRGSTGNDTLRGLAGNDSLDGGAGRDLLTGGEGADRFRFSAGSGFGQTQADRITDFNRAHGDRIEISRQAFGIAAGTAVTIQSVSTDQALNQALAGGSLLVQDQRDGALFFNQNGAAAGFGSGGVFAILTNGAGLQASDFALIA